MSYEAELYANMADSSRETAALRDRIEALERERDEARGLVTEANNSLYGSQGYFHSLNGGPYDKYHLASGIENLKSSCRAAQRKVAEIEADKARLSEALRQVRHAIMNADPNVLTDTFWMPDSVYKGGTVVDFIDAALAGSGWRAIETAPNEQEVLIAYWRWRNSMSPGTIVVQSAMRTEFHGPGIWSWVVSDNKHGPFPIRGWCDGDIVGWQPLPAAPQQGGE